MSWIKRHSFKFDVVLYGGLIILGVVLLVNESAGAILILPAGALLVRSILKQKVKEANDAKK